MARALLLVPNLMALARLVRHANPLPVASMMLHTARLQAMLPHVADVDVEGDVECGRRSNAPAEALVAGHSRGVADEGVVAPITVKNAADAKKTRGSLDCDHF